MQAAAARDDQVFQAWLEALSERHRAGLTFAQIRRGLQALSSLYVHRRQQLGPGTAFSGAGKRAAFALFYAPLHYLFAEQIIARLGLAEVALSRILDLGCGTGAVGAAWARQLGPDTVVRGVDLNAWAVQEARWDLGQLGVRGTVRRGDLDRERLPRGDAGLVLAYTVNELSPSCRDRLLARLPRAWESGVGVLVIEPIARRALPWWPVWSTAFKAAGGREDSWRFKIDLPEPLKQLDRAAGLDHQVLTGRSLCIQRQQGAQLGPSGLT